ncbi:unnamed protein product, partial [Iphiclides podalirius]
MCDPQSNGIFRRCLQGKIHQTRAKAATGLLGPAPSPYEYSPIRIYRERKRNDTRSMTSGGSKVPMITPGASEARSRVTDDPAPAAIYGPVPRLH